MRDLLTSASAGLQDKLEDASPEAVLGTVAPTDRVGIIYAQCGRLPVERVMSDDRSRSALDRAAFLELEERYRQLAEGSPDAIAIHQGGRMVYLNPAGARLLGAQHPSEVLGKSVLDFVHPDMLEVARERARRVVGGRETAEPIEERFVRLDGAMIDVQVTSMPITYGGRPAAQIVIRDVTDRKQIERERGAAEERFRHLATHAPVGIFETDEQGACRFVNECWCQITGLTPAQAAGFGWLDAIHPDDRPRVIDGWYRAAREGTEFSAEHRFLRPDGTEVWVVGAASRPSDARGPYGYIGTIMDITDRKRAESAVADALAIAEHALRVRAEFLSVATHELRTPVTSVRAAAQYMHRELDRAPNGVSERLRMMADVVDRQTLKLARMVDQLLDFSRLEGGRLVLDRQPSDLMRIVQDVAELGRTLSERHPVAVAGPRSVPIELDPLRVEQALINLVSNAVKFSPAGGTVTIEVTVPDGGQVQVVVADEGAGVPEDQRERIFERFYQVAPSERSVGMGLGLAITREIVELHGGRIWHEPGTNAGSRFVFTLPVG